MMCCEIIRKNKRNLKKWWCTFDYPINKDKTAVGARSSGRKNDDAQHRSTIARGRPGSYGSYVGVMSKSTLPPLIEKLQISIVSKF